MRPPPNPGSVRSPLGTGFRWHGLFFCAGHPGSTWIREAGFVDLPCGLGGASIVVDGELLSDGGRPEAAGRLGLEVALDGRTLGRFFPEPGPFALRIPATARPASAPARIELRLLGAGWTNTCAWLGRVLEGRPLGSRFQRFRAQSKNKRLRIRRIGTDDETVLDFSRGAAAFDIGFVTRHARIGLNLAGWFRAELGIGESVRCAARAAAAAGLPHALVPLRLPCKAAQGDHTFDDRLRDDNPWPVNVIHLDPPQSRDIDHHHGPAFRRGRYNVGYWAWELPEFPDAWVRHFDVFDEIWCPSAFTAAAIAAKSPVPVLVMPHAIDVAVPPDPDPRGTLGLPRDRFLFLFAYDLNSYSERKNPRAVLRAFRLAFGEAGHRGAGLVVKVHGVPGNERDLEALRAEASGLDGCTIIAETLPRGRVSLLQAACDCFVSLHRSEGFGLGVAEAMFLGKPVVATAWSGTAEYVHPGNGCPVNCRMVELAENHGPYTKGQRWAEPDIEHAAWHMQRLAADRMLAEGLGAAAAAAIRGEFSPARIGALYTGRLRAMALW
jgi:glycosyltransferase involved in cell wall biosynthesis